MLQLHLMASLGWCVGNLNVDSRLLELPAISYSILQEEVRPQDTVSVIGGVAGGSKQGRKAAWKFVRDNWEELYNRYQGGFLISRLIKVRAQKVLTTAVIENMRL